MRRGVFCSGARRWGGGAAVYWRSRAVQCRALSGKRLVFLFHRFRRGKGEGSSIVRKVLVNPEFTFFSKRKKKSCARRLTLGKYFSVPVLVPAVNVDCSTLA